MANSSSIEPQKSSRLKSTFPAWFHAWKTYLPLKAIVMVRRGSPTPTKPDLPTQDISISPPVALASSVTCSICESQNAFTPGDGTSFAALVFVGECPGHEADPSGSAPIDQGNQLLNRMIQSIGLKRGEVFVAHLSVEPKSPNNTHVQDLFRRIELLQPKVIVALGQKAAQTLLQSQDKIQDLRGRFFSRNPRSESSVKIMPTLHPLYLIKNPLSKREAWSDLQQVAKVLGIVLPKR